MFDGGRWLYEKLEDVTKICVSQEVSKVGPLAKNHVREERFYVTCFNLFLSCRETIQAQF